MKTTGLIITAALMALLCLMFTGCDEPGDSTGDGKAAFGGDGNGQPAGPEDTEYAWDGPVPESVTIAWVGNFRGFLKPCGCAVQQSGGLLRLGTILAELNECYVEGIVPEIQVSEPDPALAGAGDALDAMTSMLATPETDYSVWPEHTVPHPVWLIECGNFANPATHYPAERVRTHLESLATLKHLGFIAAVPGNSELQLSSDLAAEAFSGAPVRLTSCNLATTLEGVVIEPYVEITPGWYLIGTTAWSGGDPPEDAWWELGDPVAAVTSVLDGLPADARVVLVAMHQPGEVVRELAALPVTAMIGHGSANDPQWTGELVESFPPPPGKGIRLKLASIGAERAQWDIPLTEEWADDPAIVALVDGEKERIKEKLLATLGGRDPEGWRDIDWGSSEKYLPDRQGTLEAWAVAERSIYVGVRECDTCHPDCYRVWKDSTHSHALLTLIQRDEHETLDCLQCHVAGLLEPSGYDPFTKRDEVSAVTCESCHGPGSRHVALATLGGDGYELDESEVVKGDLDNCLSCHDSYNSPDFERREYWREIVHTDTWQERQQH